MVPDAPRDDDSLPRRRPAGLSQRREQVIEQLNEAFAQDLIDLSELEHRIQRAQEAESPAALHEIVSDLPAPHTAGAQSTPAPALDQSEPDTHVTILGDREYRGDWLVARQTNAVTILGDLVFDFTDTHLPAGDTDLKIFSLLGDVTIVVPEDVAVAVNLPTLLGDITNRRRRRTDAAASGKRLQVRGFSLMGDITIRTAKE